LAGKPLIAIGSGGSFSAAVFAATLHERLAGQPAKAITPFELREYPSKGHDGGCSYLLISAGGRNSDTLAAFRQLLYREPNRLILLTTEEQSPLMRLARDYRWVQRMQVAVPSGKDGFLATNSLVAFAARLAGDYARLFGEPELPSDLSGLFNPITLDQWRRDAEILWARDDLVVLFSEFWARAAPLAGETFEYECSSGAAHAV
jgi:fructoselysine-6-P-deglycase FrlB-like protein